MAHAQKPDFIFRWNGRVCLNQRGRQFSRLLEAEVCGSAVVILDTPCSEVVWRVLATHSICQFPLRSPSRASRFTEDPVGCSDYSSWLLCIERWSLLREYYTVTFPCNLSTFSTCLQYFESIKGNKKQEVNKYFVRVTSPNLLACSSGVLGAGSSKQGNTVPVICKS